LTIHSRSKEAVPARVISFVRKRRKPNKPPRQNDPRPTIRLTAGDIVRIVDDAEAALIKADRGLYQRANQIVFVAETPAKASRGRDVVTLRRRCLRKLTAQDCREISSS